MNTRIGIIEEYKEILDSSIRILKSFDTNYNLWKLENEDAPTSFDLNFNPIIEPVEYSVVNTHYNPNACVLCYKRVSYKPKQFETNIPQLPLLILIHNNFVTKNTNKYSDDSLDREFNEMLLEGTGYKSNSFCVREVLRCHFGDTDIHVQEHYTNCMVHLREDIKQFNIQGILVIGEAVNIVFKEKKDIEKYLYKIDTYLDIPTIATPGPSRLLFMKKNGYSDIKINEERAKIQRAIQQFSTILK